MRHCTRPIHCTFETLRLANARGPSGYHRLPGFGTYEQLTALGHARTTRFPFPALAGPVPR